jgi:hypothetical protein
MSKLPTSTITPSHSFRSLKSIKSITGDDTWMTKDECHYQAENTMDDWTACLKVNRIGRGTWYLSTIVWYKGASSG